MTAFRLKAQHAAPYSAVETHKTKGHWTSCANQSYPFDRPNTRWWTTSRALCAKSIRRAGAWPADWLINADGATHFFLYPFVMFGLLIAAAFLIGVFAFKITRSIPVATGGGFFGFAAVLAGPWR